MKPFYMQLRLKVLLSFCLLPFCAISLSQKRNTASLQKKNPSYSYTTLANSDRSFGYDIYVNGKLLIHQPTIPAVQGNNGFSSKDAVSKVALLVIGKIKKGEMPPTVSIDELEKLAVIVHAKGSK